VLVVPSKKTSAATARQLTPPISRALFTKPPFSKAQLLIITEKLLHMEGAPTEEQSTEVHHKNVGNMSAILSLDKRLR